MSVDVSTWNTMLLIIRFSASSTGLVDILSNLLCIRAMAPMKSMKAAAKKSAAKPAAKKAAAKATVQQAAQKRMKAQVKRDKEKAQRPNASKSDMEKAAAAEEVEQKYKSLKSGEKARFALSLQEHGIVPGKLQWMSTYGKDEASGNRNNKSIDKGMMTRYLH